MFSAKNTYKHVHYYLFEMGAVEGLVLHVSLHVPIHVRANDSHNPPSPPPKKGGEQKVNNTSNLY